MRDIIITARRQRVEITLFVLSLIVAVGINIYSIITYNRPWVELLTQIGWTVIVAVVLYIIVLLLRLVARSIIYIVNKFNPKTK